jgi:hypothetical protein
MSERDLPEGTANDGALSYEDGVAALESINLDPTEDLQEENEATPQAKTKPDADDQEADEGDGEDGAEDADGEDPDADDEDDGPGAYDKGRFAADTAKVTLEDGTVITVAELKRNNLYQRDYSRKTIELAEQRKHFDQERSQVGQVAQSLAQQREFILQAARHFLPRPPDRAMMDADPIGFMQAKAAYDEQMQIVSALQYQQKAEQARMSQDGEQSTVARRRTEAERLIQAVPEFRDRKVYDQFWSEAVDAMKEYGFAPDELQGADDHRMYLVMRDVVKYRKALKSAPKVKQDVQGKPKMFKGGRRMDPKARNSRDAQSRMDRLRREGSIEAAMDVFKDMDL